MSAKYYHLVFTRTSFLPKVIISGFSSMLMIRSLTLKVSHFGRAVMRLLEGILTRSKVAVHNICREDSIGIHGRRKVRVIGNFVKPRFPALIRVRRGNMGCRISMGSKRGAKFFLSRGCGELTVRGLYGGTGILSYFARANSFTLGTKVTKTTDMANISTSRLTMSRTATGTALGNLSSGIGFVYRSIFRLLPRLRRGNRGFSIMVLSPPTFAGSEGSVGGTMGKCERVGLHTVGLMGSNKFLTAYSYSRFVSCRLFAGAVKRTTGGMRGELHRMRCEARTPSRPVL